MSVRVERLTKLVQHCGDNAALKDAIRWRAVRLEGAVTLGKDKRTDPNQQRHVLLAYNGPWGSITKADVVACGRICSRA